MKEEDSLRVEEDGVDVLVRTWGGLGGGSHLEGSQKTGDQDFQLFNIFFLSLDHSEDQAEEDGIRMIDLY